MLRRLGTGVALTSMAALVLVGCTPPAPTETAVTATAEPAPESTADVAQQVERAREVYQSFLNARSALTRSYDSDPDVILQWATERHAATTLNDVSELVVAQKMIEGEFRVTDAFLERDTNGTLQVIVCVDNSDVAVVDRASGERTPATPTEPSLVSFVLEESLRVDAVEGAPAESAEQCDA